MINLDDDFATREDCLRLANLWLNHAVYCEEARLHGAAWNALDRALRWERWANDGRA